MKYDIHIPLYKCPLCKSDAEYDGNEYGESRIICTNINCRIHTPRCVKIETAIAIWNKRP